MYASFVRLVGRGAFGLVLDALVQFQQVADQVVEFIRQRHRGDRPGKLLLVEILRREIRVGGRVRQRRKPVLDAVRHFLDVLEQPVLLLQVALGRRACARSPCTWSTFAKVVVTSLTTVVAELRLRENLEIGRDLEHRFLHRRVLFLQLLVPVAFLAGRRVFLRLPRFHRLHAPSACIPASRRSFSSAF